jgi:hypothetical protein
MHEQVAEMSVWCGLTWNITVIPFIIPLLSTALLSMPLNLRRDEPKEEGEHLIALVGWGYSSLVVNYSDSDPNMNNKKIDPPSITKSIEQDKHELHLIDSPDSKLWPMTLTLPTTYEPSAIWSDAADLPWLQVDKRASRKRARSPEGCRIIRNRADKGAATGIAVSFDYYKSQYTFLERWRRKEIPWQL